MDRRLLFPAIAATALAQQVSPANAEAEKAVRARAEKFLQLEQAKNFRAAWALVADDTQDYFFNAGRPDFLSFTIDGVEIVDSTHAKVMFKIKRNVPIPGLGNQAFELPGVSMWKLENGDWFWYVDQTEMDTPFGKIRAKKDGESGQSAPAIPGMPDLNSLRNQVSIDKTAVSLSKDSPSQTVAILNNMPGPITIDVKAEGVAGLVVEIDNKQLVSKQKGTISFSAKPGTKPSGTVGINVQPLGQHFDVVVTSN